ncbi:MAG: citrate synthase, alpha chain [Candidatus Saccharibacteria bacterium]|nr:citrate synthase, alpha chain [Candidatus Saccharibacteria bacterium]
MEYAGVSVDTDDKGWQKHLPSKGRFVVKVDQGVKGRFKKGLVKLDVAAADLAKAVTELGSRGYRYLLIEPFAAHAEEAEFYLSIERTRAGNFVSYSRLGGIHVESKAGAIKRVRLESSSDSAAAKELGLPPESLQILADTFDDNYFAFLEINPLVITDGTPQLLDAAVEVDDEAAPFVNERWTPDDFRDPSQLTPEEEAILELASQSQASFRLKVLNPDGAFFLLLSGGGASIVVADEVNNQGHGKLLANYGEYSGNPNVEETYLYTKQVLSLMLKSKAPRKVLIIGGGVANFTDISKTFKGVVQALDEVKKPMRQQNIKVFVRRGGPNEAEGLAQMEKYLLREDLHGRVAGPELTLSKIVPLAAETVTTGAAS